MSKSLKTGSGPCSDTGFCIQLRYLVRSDGPNFIRSVRGPVRKIYTTCLSQNPPCSPAPKLNSILLPQFTDTLNIYPSPLYQVSNANWSAFLKGILPTLQSHGWNNGTHGGRQLDSEDLYLLPLAV